MIHTPGPWNLSLGEYEASIHDDSGTITSIPDDLLQWKTNAKLIAAAPDLLEACKEAFDYVNHKTFGKALKSELGRKLNYAIQKAES